MPIFVEKTNELKILKKKQKLQNTTAVCEDSVII